MNNQSDSKEFAPDCTPAAKSVNDPGRRIAAPQDGDLVLNCRHECQT
jgi:hypothetical protein